MFLTYTRDAMYRANNAIGTRSWLSYGRLWDTVGAGGLSNFYGLGGISGTNWFFATTYLH